MAGPGVGNLSNRAVNAMEFDKDTVVWDRRLTGFGVRVYPKGGKVYIAHACGPEGTWNKGIGQFTPGGALQFNEKHRASVQAPTLPIAYISPRRLFRLGPRRCNGRPLRRTSSARRA